MKVQKVFCAAAGVLFAAISVLAKPVDFATDVKPILEMNCVACHNAEHAEENGKYRIDTKEEAFKPHKKDQRISPGHPDDSEVYYTTVLPETDEARMPPSNKRPPLSKEDSETLKQWIAEGANWPDGTTLKVVMKVDFVRDVEPILEHGAPLPDTSKEILHLWLAQGGKWPAEVKFPAPKTALAAPAAAPSGPVDFARDVAPVFTQGPPLSDAGKATLVAWLDQGATWPAAYHLGRATGGAAIREMQLVEEIHERILDTSKEKAEADMKAYTNAIPGSKVTYAMVPIPSGQFTMGSPDAEPHRNAEEGPQHPVAIDPLWMEQCAVTWNEFELFMYPDENAAVSPTNGTTNYTGVMVDAVARPTKPYVEMSFGMGKDGYPAISMTQHACNIYCQWLSAKTGYFYRLPTEAEWEYAARAGTHTAYFWGDDPAQLADYAWDVDNSDMKYQKVGKKKPNPWGLCDMLGNVDQWTLDQYDPNYYKQSATVVTEPWNKPAKTYPLVVRGGSWQDDADKLRCACRRASDPSWKMQDPQLPKSIWYFTDAQFVGFRIVRPLKVPSTEEMFKYWHLGVEKE
jgi:formylglycine-generating enzyme required for sulfatase activity